MIGDIITGKSDIGRKVGEMKDRINKNGVTRGLFFFVAIPVLLATIYYSLIASDIYISQSKFSVNVEGSNSTPSALSMIMPAMSAGSNLHEAMVVRDYINSQAIIDKLEEKVKVRKIFAHPSADFIAKVSENKTREDFLSDYLSMVEVLLEESSGITTLKVRAFDPEDSEKLAKAILELTEQFVNTMSDRVQDDAVNFAKRELEKSESMVIEANNALNEFRNKNKNFDPSVTAMSILGITSKLEEEKAAATTEVANLKNYMQRDNPKISALEAKIKSLTAQIEEQNERLANKGGTLIADLAQEYESLIMQKEFAMKRYEISVASYEGAQAEARKKSKYLLTIVSPTKPEKAEEPRRLKGIFTVFISCLIGYMLFSLIIASIKDHIRP